ncbi:MAG TPA: sulfatase [Pirellulaceae bacterium]|jgi:arylsulfatase A-like enzyme|nr:sulfatase [Pirellulaceae bacterium]
MRLLAFAAIVFASACSSALAEERASESAKRPNILMISIDDLNDWVGHLGGHPQAKTPHIDSIASRGTFFANAHCQSPLCNPSRTSLFTGLRPSTTGVYALNPWFRQEERFQDLVTLPQAFERQGYVTLACGKNYHDAYPPAPDRRDGVEFTKWGFHGGYMAFPPKPFVNTPGKNKLVDWGPFPESDEGLHEYQVADWAIEQLENPPEAPFFLCVGFRRPHVPCYAPQKYFDLFPEESLIVPEAPADDRDDTPRFSWYLHWNLPEPRLKWLEEAGERKSLVRAYLASLAYTDAQVGRVLAALKESGLEQETIVVLWSDHGWHLGEKLITGKNTLWEPSTRIPLVCAGPGIVEGARCDEAVELLDIYPTLIELCGLPPRNGLEGQSLLPQLRDPTAPREAPAITTHGPGNHGIRDERWRYIRYADGSEELYDLQTDPEELKNLADEPGSRAEIERLAKWLPKSDAAPMKGSKIRLVELKDGVVYWEGDPIEPGAPIPGIEIAEGPTAPKPPARPRARATQGR